MQFQPAYTGVAQLQEFSSPLTINGSLSMTTANNASINLVTNVVNNGSFGVLVTGTPSAAVVMDSLTPAEIKSFDEAPATMLHLVVRKG